MRELKDDELCDALETEDDELCDALETEDDELCAALETEDDELCDAPEVRESCEFAESDVCEDELLFLMHSSVQEGSHKMLYSQVNVASVQSEVSVHGSPDSTPPQ